MNEIGKQYTETGNPIFSIQYSSVQEFIMAILPGPYEHVGT